MLDSWLNTPGSGGSVQRGCRSQPRQDCAGSGAPERERPDREAGLERYGERVAVEAEAGGSPSSEAPPGWLVWQAASGHPTSPPHGPWPRTSRRARARLTAGCQHTARCHAQRDAAGNRAVRGVLVR